MAKKLKWKWWLVADVDDPEVAKAWYVQYYNGTNTGLHFDFDNELHAKEFLREVKLLQIQDPLNLDLIESIARDVIEMIGA